MAGFKTGARRALGWRSRRQAKARDLMAAGDVDISGVRSVCLFLGPYRNLTTMTAAVLFLHPHCQVLNHAGTRILGDRRLDFLARYSDDTFDNFVRYAIQISGGGQRGQEGGSITLSHAFEDQYGAREAFDSSQLELVKPDVRALVWKESLTTSNHIRQHRVDLDAIFDRNKRLRFLMPVRHPLDAAVSNLKTKHFRLFEGLGDEPTLAEVVDAILDELAWFTQLQTRYPDRFFRFYEHAERDGTLRAMAEFLELEPDEEWLARAREAFDVKARYDEHPADLVAHFEQGVTERFADPATREALLQFVCS